MRRRIADDDSGDNEIKPKPDSKNDTQMKDEENDSILDLDEADLGDILNSQADNNKTSEPPASKKRNVKQVKQQKDLNDEEEAILPPSPRKPTKLTKGNIQVCYLGINSCVSYP